MIYVVAKLADIFNMFFFILLLLLSVLIDFIDNLLGSIIIAVWGECKTPGVFCG